MIYTGYVVNRVKAKQRVYVQIEANSKKEAYEKLNSHDFDMLQEEYYDDEVIEELTNGIIK